MKGKRLAGLTLITLWLALMGFAISLHAQAADSGYRPDQILIKPKPGIRLAELANFNAARKSIVLHTFARMAQVQILRVPKGETVQSLIAKYQQSGLVEYAEPDYTVHAAANLPNDPYFTEGLLWGLYNYGQSSGTAGADIGATNAWNVLTSASNIVVAVVDSGIRSTHQDLASNMWVNPNDGSHGWNAITGTNDPSDDSGHGTLMAGVIGAVGSNDVGVVGVAWQVQMMACVCLSNNGTGNDSDVLICMDYAITNGANIINASFSSTNFSLSTSNAIVAARDAGIIVVAAAGNSSADIDIQPTYPACFKIANVISVAYSTRNDTVGALSNYGATNVTLAAPGDQMYSTYDTSDTSYYPPTDLGVNIAGTSFAAAYVSGALALLEAQYPSDGYQEIINRLLNSADRVPALAGKCRTGARLNIGKALRTLDVGVLPAAGGTRFQMRVSGGLNRTCVVEASSDLASWSPVFTNTTSADGTFDYTVNVAAGQPYQFFRATASP
ncbi:MAG: S8 family peptidase [Verrucomicrobiota bacterium]